MSIKRVSVVGAGTMGNGIAHVFGQQGYSTSLIDISKEALHQGLSTIRKNLSRQVEKGKLSEEDAKKALERITTTTNNEEGISGADLVVEAVSERENVKAAVFADMDRYAPDHAILSSNTSSISITWLGAQTTRPEQVIGMHFFNPVPVMKLVEVVRGLSTTEETFSQVYQLSKALGKEPVEVKDYPGFVSNRILMPMINEAIFCVMEGVAGEEDIDTVMKVGMNHPMGPLTLADFIGLDVCLSIMQVLHNQLGDDKYRPCPLLRKKVAAGQLGRKAGEGFFSYE